MSVFYDIKGKSVNVSKIREIGIARKDALRIIFDDGDSEIYSVYGDAADEKERLGMVITQLIPCSASFYNIYDNEDGGYFRERVDFFALCADGAVRSLSNADGYFVIADVTSNFIGCFEESRLSYFPESPSEA